MPIMHVQVSQNSDTSVREETLQGRSYLVVPMVALVEGVANGEKVTREEIAKSAQLWNGRPIPVGHPQRNGTPVSANSVEFERELNIGRVFNARENNGKLLMEGWIDIEHAKTLGFTDVLDRLRSNGSPMELSTAFWPTATSEDGTFKGRRYSKILTDLKPDHVALLPNEKGACSVATGCGVPRINSQQSDDEEERFFSRLAKFLFSSRSNRMDQKTREKHVNSLIANEKTIWDSDDKGTLLALSDEKLTTLSEECSCKNNDNDNNKDTDKNNKDNTVTANNNKDNNNNDNDTAKAVELAVQNAIKPLNDRLERIESNHKEKHTETVERLVANKECKVAKTDLENMSIETLESIESMLPSATSKRNPYKPNFAGRGTSKLANNKNNNNNDGDDDDSWKSPPSTLTSKPSAEKKEAS